MLTHVVDGPEPESHLPVLVLTEDNLPQPWADLCPPDADVCPRHWPHHAPDTWAGGHCYLLRRGKEVRQQGRWESGRGGLRKNKREIEWGVRKRWEEKRIKEACYIKIQLEIKRNAASNRIMWEDSISSPPPPVNEIRNALGTVFENFIFNMLCTTKEENKNIRKTMVEVKMSANCREHRWLNVSGQARVLWEPGHLQDPHVHIYTHTHAIGGEWRAHTLPHSAPGLRWVTQLCGSPGTEYCCALIYLQKTGFNHWGWWFEVKGFNVAWNLWSRFLITWLLFFDPNIKTIFFG